ncbi:hypothetical protein B0J18DRAFT_368282 [Chaetomium sp. MPI-SDFR-AT-0129]|nr:hypothetical protein B0J18DRAFT_368282 [Chaetomium sp. MPI-SDFR-AT-0129]
MAQLVSNFLITPVLRQARRFSAGFAADDAPATDPPSMQRPRAQSTGFPGALGTAIVERDHENGITIEGGGTLASDTPLESPGYDHDAVPSPASGPDAVTSTTATPEPDTSIASTAMTRPSPNLTAEMSQQNSLSPTPEGMGNTRSSSRPRTTPIPEDDGMRDLRRRIQAVQLLEVTQDAKAQLMHGLLTEKYTSLQQHLPKPSSVGLRPVSRASASAVDDHQEPLGSGGALQNWMKWNPLADSSGSSGPVDLPLTEEDLEPTFAPKPQSEDRKDWWSVEENQEEEESRLGCQHYRRNVKLQCFTCDRWYTCRHCHDAVEDHALPRQQTKHMLCMICGCAQKVSDTCTRCYTTAANYYCGVCKLWSDDPNKPMYHCPDCGLCRVGQGLGKDFSHCKRCMACVSMSDTNHKCIERAVDSDCPICNEYLLDSPKSVTFMQCGHSIHVDCLEELKKTSYRCPLCNKSCTNMEYTFRQLDLQILAQPMPPNYADSRAIISCNDCSAKSQTAYHWIGLKCAICSSYNTTQLQLLDMPGGDAAAEHQQSQPEPHHLQSGQQPIALDPALVDEEMRRRNRASRRQQERQRNSDQNRSQNQRRGSSNSMIGASAMQQALGLLATSPSAYSRALITRLLNRGAPPADNPPSVVEEEDPKSASLLSPASATVSPPPVVTSARAEDGDSDSDDDDDGEMDMLDLFGGRDRDFDRAESAVGFDDDEDVSSDEDGSDGDPEDGDDDYDEDDEDEVEDDILLLGHR